LPAKPNFFIAGAPKCGTTALYEYLRSHPQVFMPELKEPHFFSNDLITYHFVKNLAEYNQLFEEATSQHVRVGEASASYLLSTAAIPAIRKFNPDAKIIAMFRNPIDMVYSFHSQLLYWSQESEDDFETAWRLQECRRNGLHVPRTCREPFWLQYREIGRFGTQVQRLLSVFPPDQVKLILYDDFAVSPQRIYDEVIDFFGLTHDNRAEFPRINENKRARLSWLRDFYRKPPPLLLGGYRRFKHTAVGKHLTSLKEWIIDINTVRERRPPLSPEFRAELVETFREEVALLSRILDRDLSHWR
jgi:sulfotransferase family protein